MSGPFGLGSDCSQGLSGSPYIKNYQVGSGSDGHEDKYFAPEKTSTPKSKKLGTENIGNIHSIPYKAYTVLLRVICLRLSSIPIYPTHAEKNQYGLMLNT